MKIYICDKCKSEINIENEQIWSINQVGEYYSNCDGTTLKLDFCDNCLQNFIGGVEHE